LPKTPPAPSSEGRGDPNDTGRKRILAVALALFVTLAIEGIAQAFYLGVYGAAYSPTDLARHAEHTSPFDADNLQRRPGGPEDPRILHPYLGYSPDHRRTMGINGKEHPLQKRGEGRFVVAVAGGSVANQLKAELRRAFQDVFAERGLDLEAVVIGLSVDGYKQPQQLASVSYFLSVGAEFDAVINVDGFNEIVLPLVDNYSRQIYPFYPRGWQTLVQRRPSQGTVLRAGEIAFLREQQADQIRSAESVWWGRSAWVGIWKSRGLRRSSARIATLQRELLAEENELTYEAQGPFEDYDDIAQAYLEAAKVWSRSSILMKHVLDGVDTPYFHALQPNQYVEGSKVLTDHEKQTSHDLKHPYASTATGGYKFLFDASQEIEKSGVRFMDATPIFEDVLDDVYIDVCCHLNQFGQKLLARALADWVTDSVFGPRS
jgi:hypothetical protein